MWSWETIRESLGSLVPPYLRRGLLRLYIVIAVPWIAWFGFQTISALDQHGPVWRYVSAPLLSLLIVPVGAPILFFAIVWVFAGFRSSVPNQDDFPGLDPESVWDVLRKNPNFQKQKEMFEFQSLLCESGVDADELPNAQGEFGMTPSNPVPCKTVFGSNAYLDRLRAPDGSKVVYRRVGYLPSNITPQPVDAYVLYHSNGEKLATIYISPYQKRISGKAPRGDRKSVV